MTIEKLSDEVLFRLFRCYLDSSPQHWPRLVHICRNWRRIIFASQRALHLRLFCTHGSPVSKALDYWPALPITIQYGGSPTLNPPAPEDEGNIMVALKQSGRVSGINLTVTRSLLANISTIKEPFSELEELVLLSRDDTQLILPSAFRWGPRLRRLHSTGITFPALLRRLSSSSNLVDIRLHGISYNRYLSPKALAKTLSGMAQLQSLSLHFHSTANRITMPLPQERVLLHALARLSFRGTTMFLEGFLAMIDAPRLGGIEITFLDEPTFGVSNLCTLIDRVEMQKSHRQADILFSEHSATISLTQPAPMYLKLEVLCKSLSWQLFYMAQICRFFSTFLFCVDDLRITNRLSSRRNNEKRWLDLIRPFRGTKWFYVAGDFSTDILFALHKSSRRRRETVLPALHKLCILEPESDCPPLREAIESFAVESFVGSCWLSGRFIAVEYERPRHACSLHGSGTMCTQCQEHMLTYFDQDLFLSRLRLRCLQMTSF